MLARQSSAIVSNVHALRIGRALALVAVSLALASGARAQSVLAPNVTWDGDDFDLSDGRCDADAATPGDQCTLRAALQNVQLPGAAASWIIPLAQATYTLTDWGTDDDCAHGDLDVFADRDIILQGVPGTTIDATPLASGGHPERVLDIHPTPNPARRVELHALFLRGGRSGGAAGGAIRHRGGELSLDVTGVIDHQGGSGGGIYIGAPFSMRGGEISLCTAAATEGGGGAYVDAAGASVSFQGVTFNGDHSGQSGGGLWIEPFSSASLSFCTFTSNTAARGGALALGGSATLTSCAVSGNASSGAGGGAALLFGANLQLSLCGFDFNTAGSSGGGLHVEPGATRVMSDTFLDHGTAATLGGGLFSGGSTRVERCTLSQNSASSGGGLYALSFAAATMTTLVNSTLSQNHATSGQGGALRVAGSASTSLSSCTLAFNDAASAGAGVWADAPVSVRGTLFFGNTLPFNVKQNFAGSVPLTSFHANLDSDGTCAFPAGSQSGSQLAPLDPHLGPLQPNGGPTSTHAFTQCSLAIGTGACDDVSGIALAIDQRGSARGAPCDVGAYEDSNGLCAGAIVNFCAGDGLSAGMVPCPCSFGAPGHGCANSSSAMGALLDSSGTPCNNDVVLRASSMPATTTGIYLMGDTAIAGGALYGDGVRCVGGALLRLGTQLASGGQSQYPPSGSSVTLAQRSGVVPCSGVVRYYQEYYRNAAAAFCPPATFNITNGLIVNW